MKLLGEGAYAHVYKAFPIDKDQEDFDDDIDTDNVVIKVQKPACPWEFYISTELRKRLEQLNMQSNVVWVHYTVMLLFRLKSDIRIFRNLSKVKSVQSVEKTVNRG